MADWKFGQPWSHDELKAHFELYRHLDVNFERPKDEALGWNRYYSEARIGFEPPGVPVADGLFERTWKSVQNYEFSDPSIVRGYFNKKVPLEGRTMLLEIRVLGLRYLCGVRIGAVRDRRKAGMTIRGFRYDTLQGHIERGTEWFLVTKKEESGEVWFGIHASWRPGEFPNWWSRVGFHLLARNYQLAWHRAAYRRLRANRRPEERSRKACVRNTEHEEHEDKIGLMRSDLGRLREFEDFQESE